MINPFRKKKKRLLSGTVGLALGSGSARGWAHIGVIRALTEAGIHVDYIAGTSIGALVGAVYASSSIMETQITTTRLQTDPPDFLIQPDLGHIKFLEYNRARETIAVGYQEARVRLDLLRGQ